VVFQPLIKPNYLKINPKKEKIKRILIELEIKGIIKQRKSKQDFLGIKETAYNLILDLKN